MIIAYVWRTRFGPISVRRRGERWSVIFDDEDLGSYHSAAAAIDDVAGGHTFTPNRGVDFERLGVPGDIGEWERVDR